MNKKNIYVIVSIAVFVCLVIGVISSIYKAEKEAPKYTFKENLVSMTIKANSLTNSLATFILVNHTDSSYLYGEPYLIEYEKDNIWYALNPIIDNYGFNMIGYILQPKSSKEIEINWAWLYGELKPGKYRLIKDIGNFSVGTEFIIE